MQHKDLRRSIPLYYLMTDIISLAKEYLRERNPNGYSSTPNSINISFDDNKDQFEISGWFKEADEEDNWANRVSVFVLDDTDLKDIFHSYFKTIESNITVKKGDLEVLSVSEKTEENNPFDEWEFYTHKTADSRILVRVNYDAVPENIKEQLFSEMLTEIKTTTDPSLLRHQLINTKLLYADTQQNVVQKIEGTVSTPNPHRYYGDSVLSVTEFHLKKRANTNNTYNRISIQDEYVAGYFLNNFSEYEDHPLQDIGVTVMKEFVDETFYTDYEYLLEGECIFVGDFSDEKFEREGITYYVHIPVTDDKIGVLKRERSK